MAAEKRVARTMVGGIRGVIRKATNTRRTMGLIQGEETKVRGKAEISNPHLPG